MSTMRSGANANANFTSELADADSLQLLFLSVYPYKTIQHSISVKFKCEEIGAR